MNKIMLIGRLGKDPETRYTADGTPVCNFSMATSERYKGRDGNIVEKTEWHDCVRFGPGAESLAEHLRKGSRVYVGGQVETKAWEKDGQKYSKKQVKMTEWEYLDSKKESDGAASTVGEDVPF